MLHLVAYDIASPKRLRKVARICEDFGLRVEFSVFECELDDDLFSSFWARLASVIDPGEDCVIAYSICGSCLAKTLSCGTRGRPCKPAFYLF
jgi:CRISPR-associated protein Cas2